ncbi:hypothetical protein O3M35_009470 [Rhynocoris fuscipes]|uniref:Kinesin-like protein n=1 Tax=Rhynocoris fuscipes TaxID=488301 RepID=A0AAW1D6K8_9HEMI
MKRNFRGQKSGSGNLVNKEPIEVYCRVKPLNNSEESCLTVIPPNQIKISPPLSYFRNGGPTKAMLYTFKKVYDDSTSQKSIFTSVALPLIQNVLTGKNGLIFTYGVTGSGKTFTMTGNGQDGGILPRCLDTIFNSISSYQAKKHIFKPDRLNGFDIQSEEEALADKEQDLLAQILSSKGNRNKIDKKGSEPDLVGRVRDATKIENIDEDNVYAVFITYVEIYNNTVYDLLDDVFEDKAKPLQAKIIREDASRNMYVHAANELEVYSTDEAFEIYYRAQKRKRVGQTLLNQESSRSHSIFTIKVVQAPLDEDGEKVVTDKKTMIISQLSLVDLAGSERTNRTKNTGQRLKEAGNINNSLLTLRTCLELLRENQNGANKMIPYRESRLTHLFKNYFDGEGQVTMIVCVSQHADDYDENLQVMKFAEISQEVQISCPSAVKATTCYTPGRRRANLAFKEAVNSEGLDNDGAGDVPPGPSEFVFNKNFISGVPKGLGLFGNSFTEIPDLRFIEPDENGAVPKFCNYMEENLKKFSELATEFQKKRFDLRDTLMQSERQAFLTSQQVQSLKSLYEKEKEKISALETRAMNADAQAAKLKRKTDEYEVTIKKLKLEVAEKESLLNQNRAEKDKVKEHYTNKLTQTQEKLNKEMERKLRSQKSALQYEMRSKDEKLRAVRRLLSDENIANFENIPGNRARLPVDSRSVESLMNAVDTPKASGPAGSVAATPIAGTPSGVTVRQTCRRMGVAVANRRHRRSRSAGDVWLEHKPKTPVPLNTLMQPTMTKRKSVTKLTDAKDVTEKTSKYCLMTQGQDSDGDLETRLYKGDVIPTAGGGAQVMFNDVEVLKQVSPTVSPSRKRPDEIRRDIEAACSIALEGHKIRRKNFKDEK